MKTTATINQLELALANVNKKYADNVIFNRIEPVNSKRNVFTLKVKDSSGKGSARSWSGRKTGSACWHVHGYFFEELFKLDSAIIINSLGSNITSEHGNWIDQNVGSIAQPALHSNCCECGQQQA